MLVSSLPAANKTPRMRVWRALKACGAGALRDGVYVLPDSDAARAILKEQADDVVTNGGSAHVVSFGSETDVQHRDLVKLFDRSDQYAVLLGKLNRMKGRMSKVDEVDARRTLIGLRREFDSVTAIDFFGGASRRQVESAFADAEAALNARFSPDEPHSIADAVSKRDAAAYRKRTWATRERPWVDRVASAWLIRRFIDTQAKFLWLKKPKDCPRTAIGFDFDGAEFSHVGGRVTFEVLAASFGLSEDHALSRLGALVHHLDVGGVPVPEAAGFAAIAAGMRAEQADDDEFLGGMSPVLDALYVSYSEATEG
jgi:hypothetical protein